MTDPSGAATRRNDLASTRKAPDDAVHVQVRPHADGGPADILSMGRGDAGVDVVPNGRRHASTAPYRSMASLAVSDGASDPGTWTLVSLADDGGSMKVWHQHGAGTVPVPMQAVLVSSSRVPDAYGRSFVCPECDDLTVVGLPTS